MQNTRQQRIAEIYDINSIQTRFDQWEALEKHKTKFAKLHARTRRNCHGCQCVLYVRSTGDNGEDGRDLDEMIDGYCFRCANGMHSSGDGSEGLRPEGVYDRMFDFMREGDGLMWQLRKSL